MSSSQTPRSGRKEVHVAMLSLRMNHLIAKSPVVHMVIIGAPKFF